VVSVFPAVMVRSPPESRSQIGLADVGEQHSQRWHSPACLKGDGAGDFCDEAVDRDEISRQVVLPEPGTEHMLIGRPAAIRKASGLHSVCRSPAAEGNKGPVFAPLL